MHECSQHLERAQRSVELTDFDRHVDQLNKAIQFVDSIFESVNSARDTLLLPKKKRIDDLRRNRNTVRQLRIKRKQHMQSF